jgi:tetratricopeptide (TPR) repeat protein
MRTIIYILALTFALQYCYADYEDAQQYFSDGNYKKAEKELISLPKTAKVLNALGLVKNAMGEFKLAMDSYNRALEIAEDSMAMIIHLNRGICYSDYGYLKESKKEYETAAKMAKALNNMSVYSKAIHSIGLYYYDINNNEMANKYLHDALSLTDEIDVKADIYHNLARIKEENGKNDEALEMYLKSLEMERKSDKASDEEKLSNAYSNIGLCYLKMDNIDKAGEYMDSAFTGLAGSYQYNLLSNFMNYYKVKKYEAKIDSIEQMIIIAALTLIIALLTVAVIYSRRKIRRRELQIEKVRQLIASQM